MATPTNGTVVLVRFPFSDLSSSKLRPAVVLAQAGRNDVILCQITSQSYSDTNSIVLDTKSFSVGSLHRSSYVRPSKLFTSNDSIIQRKLAVLTDLAFEQILGSVRDLFKSDD